MHNITELIKRMCDELDDSKDYYDLEITLKDEAPLIATTYLDLAKEELNHCDKLHTTAINYINKLKASGEDITKATVAVWSFAHNQITLAYDDLKYRINRISI